MSHLILLPRIQVQNANALSSPYTLGFPAMTAWLGAGHALQRQLNQNGFPDLRIQGVGVCCHQMQLHSYKGPGDYVSSIIGTANPLDKKGARPAFIEEARCHLNISLVLECSGFQDPSQHESCLEQMPQILLSRLKLAGGDILSVNPALSFNPDTEEEQRKLMLKLMPGYVLIERRELIQGAMQEGEDALDALLRYVQIKHFSTEEPESGHIEWQSQRETKGWIVPIATGFHGVSPLGSAQHQRDPTVPHRFAEAVVTLGEFKMPYRLNNLVDMLWRYHVDLDKNLYLCQTDQTLQGVA